MGLFDIFKKKVTVIPAEPDASQAKVYTRQDLIDAGASDQTLIDAGYEPVHKETKPKKPRAPRKPKKEKVLTPEQQREAAKAAATAQGQPWVDIVSFELDVDNVGQGAFELDWNQEFVNQLRMAGYPGKTDTDVVDNWFQTVCRNIALETWEQYEADPLTRVNRKNLGGGRTEVS